MACWSTRLARCPSRSRPKDHPRAVQPRGRELDYCVFAGPTPKDVISRLTALTGRSPPPPAWTFGLWLTTSFTTQYDEATVTHFIDEMARRDMLLAVFHFDCFWMREFQWCDFEWNPAASLSPEAMLARLRAKGLKDFALDQSLHRPEVAALPAVAAKGYLLKRPNGQTWQTDLWQPGMGIVDFTNLAATAWYQATCAD